MKEVYLAYFDFLGFKEFIQKNEDKVIISRMGHIFRDIENCLGQDKLQDPLNGLRLADTTQSKLNCLNISDTVLIWTNNCEQDSLIELIDVAYEFNLREINYTFPLRGSILKGKIRVDTGRQTNSEGGSYSVQCVYGKGILDAHQKAESQNWAGTVIDQTIINDLTEFGLIDLINKKTTRYPVPYKMGEIEEFVFKITRGQLNDIKLENTLKDIEGVFSKDNKNIEKESVKLKLENTKKFIIDTKDIH